MAFSIPKRRISQDNLLIFFKCQIIFLFDGKKNTFKKLLKKFIKINVNYS